MASRIQGITVEIGGDTTKLSTALSKVNKEIRDTQAQLKDVNKLLKLDPGNAELMAQKQRLLSQAVSETKEKLDALKLAGQQANEALAKGEISRSQYDALQREIVETEQALRDLERQAEQSSVALQKIGAAGEKLQSVGSSMKVKGTMVLELTDGATGDVETVTEENMVTEAVNNILGMNPMGVFYSEERLADVMSWNDTMLPVCPNMIGGILLFPKTLEEDAGHIYEMSDNLPVAYASNNVNTTANAARGSLNQTESKVLENGYKFVWEFTPSQGNGTIAAVALTSAQGGQNGYGSLVGDASAFLQIKKLDIGDLGKAKQAVLFEAVEMDFERDLLYSITFEDSSVRVRKVRIPVFSIGLNERLDDSAYTVLEDRAVPVETFLFLGSYTKYGEFLDGQDGYWYGFSNEANSSGNARVLWVRVSKTDYSMTEGEWTLSNAKLMAVGERDMTGSYPERKCRCCMRGGYLYVPAYDKKGIYKINVANTADVSLIEFGFTSKMKPLCDTGTCELYLTLVGDLIVGGDFQVTVSDAVIHTQGSARLGSAATPLFQYKQFLVGWGGSYGNEYRHMYLLTPYLATINNLSSAVVKDANKTMKITYTLTEVEGAEA